LQAVAPCRATACSAEENLSVKQAAVLTEFQVTTWVTVGRKSITVSVSQVVGSQISRQLTNSVHGSEGNGTRAITTTAWLFEPAVGISNAATLRDALRIRSYADARYSIGTVSVSEFGKEFPNGELIAEVAGLPIDAFGFENSQASHMYLPFF